MTPFSLSCVSSFYVLTLPLSFRCVDKTLIQSPAIPIALRVVYAKRFVRGPFHLGPFSYPVAIAAVTWIAFISIAFILPSENPVNSQTLNYTIVAVGIILAYSMGFWVLSARKWFTGPVKQIAGEYFLVFRLGRDAC